MVIAPLVDDQVEHAADGVVLPAPLGRGSEDLAPLHLERTSAHGAHRLLPRVRSLTQIRDIDDHGQHPQRRRRLLDDTRDSGLNAGGQGATREFPPAA